MPLTRTQATVTDDLAVRPVVPTFVPPETAEAIQGLNKLAFARQATRAAQPVAFTLQTRAWTQVNSDRQGV